MHRIHRARRPRVGAGCKAVATCGSNGQGASRKPDVAQARSRVRQALQCSTTAYKGQGKWLSMTLFSCSH